MPANDHLYDLSLRHAIGVQRVTGSHVNAVLKLLADAEKDLQRKLLARLKPDDWTSKRYKVLLKDIREMRQALFTTAHADTRTQLLALAKAEQQFTRNIVKAALPVELDFAVASAETLRTLVTATPFSGGANAARTLGQWWQGVAAADQRRIVEAIQFGMVQGETVPEMTARVLASQKLTRVNAEAVVRTAANHVSNSSRNEFFKENKNIFEVMLWVSTLDGRTTEECMANDGCYDAVDIDTPPERIPEPHLDPPGSRPPAHPQCRSIMVAMLNAEGVADQMPDRPYVRDARTREMREHDFRAEARDTAGPQWAKMSRQERAGAVRDLKRAWAQEAIGTVPARTSYDQWLRQQPVSFQRDVLGVGKAQMFREGLKLQQFTEGSRVLTLQELQVKFPSYVP